MSNVMFYHLHCGYLKAYLKKKNKLEGGKKKPILNLNYLAIKLYVVKC